MTPPPLPAPSGVPASPASTAVGKTEARPRPKDPHTGWRYAAELEVERSALLRQAVADRAHIEALAGYGALFNAAMRAYAQTQRPHVVAQAHPIAGCPPCEGHQRLQALLAEQLAAHPEDPAYAVAS